MTVIWTSEGIYSEVGYSSESDLESAISQVHHELFGPGRVYLDVKKKIGKGKVQNIPDGYLIDLSGKIPRLYVVEAELVCHDPLRHIAVQILEFSLSFEAEPLGVKRVVYDALQQDEPGKTLCESYAADHGYNNLDRLLEAMVFESPFAALVIIDQMPEDLENVLAKSFQFGVETLELACYQNDEGERLYRFEPFLADITEDIAGKRKEKVAVDTSEMDTIVVPAREDSFEKTFIGENRWYPVRIHGSMRPQIRYIAVYRVAPVKAITHIAAVRSIEPWQDTDRFVLNFSSPPEPIGPISLGANGRGRGIMGPKYTSRTRLESAKTLSDI